MNAPTWTTGQVGGALSFDGVNDFVNRSSMIGLNRSALTFTFWSRQLGIMGHFMNLIGIFGGARAIVYPSQNSYRYAFRFTSINGVNYDTVIATLNDQWHFIAITFNGTEKRAYINGVLVVTRAAPGTITDGDESLFIGTAGTGLTPAANWFFGLIDDVRIYNRALSPAEIAAIFNATR